MKASALPVAWARWRRRRYRALAGQGLARDLAWRVAAGEAAGRHRISGIVGDRAARDADLVVIGRGKNMRFALRGDFAGLTAEQRAAVERLNITVAAESA